MAAQPTLPTYIRENVDAIRQYGNFSTHPPRGKASDSLMDVEPGEAEWTLDILDQLFDFYYVQPARSARKRTALNAKLSATGKPAMK